MEEKEEKLTTDKIDEKTTHIVAVEKEQKKKLVEFKTTMSLVGFGDELMRLNLNGRDLTLRHKELWGAHKADKDAPNGKRYHAPGTDPKCPNCDQIFKNYENYMHLQSSQIGLSGIEFESLMSAIKITRATILMMKNGGEL